MDQATTDKMNAPCTCGSGKMMKDCCGKAAWEKSQKEKEGKPSA